MTQILQSSEALDTPIYRDDVLTLLALTALADNRILSTEVFVFAKMGKTIEAELGLVKTFSEGGLLIWFEENRAQLKEMVRTENFAVQAVALLKRLSSIENKQPIFNAMLKIAQADSELHVSEQALIALARIHWSIPVRFENKSAA